MKKPFLLLMAVLFIFTANAQSKFFFGPMVGLNISRVNNNNDTFPTNYTRRNYLGPAIGLAMKYDLNYAASLNFTVSLIKKGYKINSDTLGSDASISRGIYALNMPFGITFKQLFNGSNFIMEKFGVVANLNLRKDSTVINNRSNNPVYSITEIAQRNFYPLFFLGISMGGNSENGNRYEFGVTYQQSFSKDAAMRVNYGKNMEKSFPLSFRGGLLQIGFTYFFNWSNVKVKHTEYFTD